LAQGKVKSLKEIGDEVEELHLMLIAIQK